MNTNFHTESRMREICTYGSMRGRAYPTRGVPLYSTGVDIGTNQWADGAGPACGESTRPGAMPLKWQEEWSRLELFRVH